MAAGGRWCHFAAYLQPLHHHLRVLGRFVPQVKQLLLHLHMWRGAGTARRRVGWQSREDNSPITKLPPPSHLLLFLSSTYPALRSGAFEAKASCLDHLPLLSTSPASSSQPSAPSTPPNPLLHPLLPTLLLLPPPAPPPPPNLTRSPPLTSPAPKLFLSPNHAARSSQRPCRG